MYTLGRSGHSPEIYQQQVTLSPSLGPSIDLSEYVCSLKKNDKVPVHLYTSFVKMLWTPVEEEPDKSGSKTLNIPNLPIKSLYMAGVCHG